MKKSLDLYFGQLDTTTYRFFCAQHLKFLCIYAPDKQLEVVDFRREVKGQPSAMWLFKKLCRIDGIEKRKEKKKRKMKKKGTVK